MQWLRRLFLFAAVNILVVLTLSLILQVLGVRPYLTAYGLDLYSLLIFCLIWGFGGAFISLLLSRKMATWLMKVRLLDPHSAHPEHSSFVLLVHSLSRQAGLTEMPQVGIYDSLEMNAFATGPSKRRALVAVSSGLLNKMTRDELEGVLAHEISHIVNGDMITMTLLQGIVNAFVMLLASILAYLFASMGNRSKERSSQSMNSFAYPFLVYLFEFAFLILGSLAIAFFSRKREFRADRGGAFLARKRKMIAALESLKAASREKEKGFEKAAFQSLKISTPSKRGLVALFATHPPLEERIERLKETEVVWV